MKTAEKIQRWFFTVPLFSFPRKLVGKLFLKYLASKNAKIVYDNRIIGIENETLELIRRIEKETDTTLHEYDAYHVHQTAKSMNKVKGDFAEVGCYAGGSSKLICEVTEKPFFVFDTFEGLPPIHDKDGVLFFQGQYRSQFEKVKKYLAPYPNAHVYKGLFPKETGHIVADKQFAFVILDVDLYESTLQSLEFFYPRMSVGGVITSHDYPSVKGVKVAFDEFFADKPEVVLEVVGTTYGIVVKC